MSELLQVSEIYGPVLQGEGPDAGRPCVFVRMFGCDSRCAQCDSLYAVDPNRNDAQTRKRMSHADLAREVERIDDALPVVFSGGNPAIWDLYPAIQLLRPNHRVWVETQGTYWADWLALCDHVIVSPKGPFMADARYGNTPISGLAKFVHKVPSDRLFFKVVCHSSLDFDYAEQVAKAFPWTPMYLSVGNELVPTQPERWTEYTPPDALGLLDTYRELTELLLAGTDRWPQLAMRAHFAPQLHVLTYGNERGV